MHLIVIDKGVMQRGVIIEPQVAAEPYKVGHVAMVTAVDWRLDAG